MKSLAGQDSSVVLSVGALNVEQEIKEEGKQDDDKIEDVGLEVAAPEISLASSGGRLRHKTLFKDASQGPVFVKIAKSASRGPVFVKIAKSIEKRLPGSTGRPGRKARFKKIYEVPRVLRQEDWSGYMYEPQLTSIGPYHRGKIGLQRMEEKKFGHLQRILSRNKKVKLKDYKEAIYKLEQRARKCYSQSISEITKDEFVEMMLLDGCFLVEIFLQNDVPDEVAPPIYGEMWLDDFVSRDMLLLENQLPYFILRRIFELVVGNRKKVVPMEKLALDCFKYIPVMPLNHRASMKEDYDHLVDLFHHHCLPNSSNDGGGMDSSIKAKLVRLVKDSVTSFFSRKPEMQWDQQLPFHAPQARAFDCRKKIVGPVKAVVDCGKKIAGPVKAVINCATSFFLGLLKENQEKRPWPIPSAEELEEAGVIFKSKNEMEDNFLSIEFHKNGVLEITYIFFSNSVNRVIQNFIAFELEQQCYNADTFFTDYAIFMNYLINTDKDVKILRRSGVLNHGLGSDKELAHVCNRMARGARGTAKTRFAELFKDINEYCGRRRNVWRANLMHNYCNTPWAFLSFFAALVLLVLTMTQTFFSIFPRK